MLAPSATYLYLVLGVILLGLGAARPISAQDSVEEVIVEAAQSQGELLDDFVSVAALDAEKLKDAGIENIEDVAAYVPNLVLTQTESGTNIFIRGIGSGVNQGFDQSVGLFSDGVPLPRANMARAPFLDLASVQVKRGPQYTLDGNYAIAGSIQLISNLAIEEFKAGFDYNYRPSHNDHTLLMTVGGPISDVLAANVVVQRKTSDGYIENVFLGRNERQQDEIFGRLVLGYQPTDAFSIKLKAEKGRFDSTGGAAEILFDMEAPDVNTFPGRFPSQRQPSSVQEEDLVLKPQRIDFDVPTANRNVIPDDPLTFPEIFWTQGKSYSDLLAETIRINGGEAPSGLGDTSLDFKRAVDVDEFSNNESLNLTLSAKWLLGEHTLGWVGSYIEYSLDELIDADFTPIRFIQAAQQEDYEQQFFSLSYRSPKDSFIAIQAGLWYMEADLKYAQNIDPLLTQRLAADGSALSAADNDDWQRIGGYYEDRAQLTQPDPARAYIGYRQFGIETIDGFLSMTPRRDFSQDQSLQAAFTRAQINWSDSFRTVLGLRYTLSNKSALRDVGFTNSSTGLPVTLDELADPDIFRTFLRSVDANAALLGVQFHSCQLGEGADFVADFEAMGVRAPPGAVPNPSQSCIAGSRREETLLPSITLEWDVLPDLALRFAFRKADKLGGFDARSNTTPTVPSSGAGLALGTFEFENEQASVFEIGARWYLFGGLGEINATAFYTDYTNLQISRSDGKSGSLVDNAGAAVTHGIEIEGYLQPTEKFNIAYSLAWTNFEFTKFELGSCHMARRSDYYFVPDTFARFSAFTAITQPAPANLARKHSGEVFERGLTPIRYDVRRVSDDGPWQALDGQPIVNVNGTDNFENFHGFPNFCDFKGQTNQYVADWQGTVSLNYESEIRNLGLLKPTLDILYNSGYHTSASQDPLSYQDAYVQLNGRLGVADFDNIWAVAITLENITNEKIVSYSNDTPLGSRFQGARGMFGYSRPPRTMGLNIRYNFY